MQTGFNQNGDVLSAIWDYIVFFARRYAGPGFWASSEPVGLLVRTSEADCIFGSVNDFFSRLFFFFIPRQIKTKTRVTTVVPSAGRPRLLSLSTFYYLVPEFFWCEFCCTYVPTYGLTILIRTIYTNNFTFTCNLPSMVPRHRFTGRPPS